MFSLRCGKASHFAERLRLRETAQEMRAIAGEMRPNFDKTTMQYLQKPSANCQSQMHYSLSKAARVSSQKILIETKLYSAVTLT